MKLKKQYNNITLYFEIIYEKTLEKENVLEDILKSLHGFKFINKNKPFNDLIKEQKKYPKHILVDFVPSVFDELKFIIRSVYNFLIETNQDHLLMIDEMHIEIDNNVFIVYSSECIRKHLDNTVTFSPEIRSCWSTQPSLIEHILRRPSNFL